MSLSKKKSLNFEFISLNSELMSHNSVNSIQFFPQNCKGEKCQNSLSSGVNSYVFYFIPDKMTWTEAQTYCRKHHTDLATVNDQTDLDELLKTLPKGFKSNIWIGLYRMNAKAPWVFSDGSSSLFRPWISGQPNNSGGYQHCVYTDPDGYWNDWQCTDPFHFLPNHPHIYTDCVLLATF
uniref:C-type lectin domain-containing protein n=1 Tax=Sinocyclocheilus grahami TaxID=75366 RepID=A0A672NSQ7_SINGR